MLLFLFDSLELILYQIPDLLELWICHQTIIQLDQRRAFFLPYCHFGHTHDLGYVAVRPVWRVGHQRHIVRYWATNRAIFGAHDTSIIPVGPFLFFAMMNSAAFAFPFHSCSPT